MQRCYHLSYDKIGKINCDNITQYVRGTWLSKIIIILHIWPAEAIVLERNPNRGRGWEGRYTGEGGVFLLAPTVTDRLPVAAARLNRTRSPPPTPTTTTRRDGSLLLRCTRVVHSVA